MQKHIKNFLKHYNTSSDEYFACQYCNNVQAVDIHHIVPRSSQGSDEVTNLIGLCRDCHLQSHKQQEPYITVEELQLKKQSLKT